jgi:hypothetical protein
MLVLSATFIRAEQRADAPRAGGDEPPVAPKPWAEKLFAKDNVPYLGHDFGKVPYGTQLHHGFLITNIYAVPIEIAAIRSS